MARPVQADHYCGLGFLLVGFGCLVVMCVGHDVIGFVSVVCQEIKV